MTDMSHISVAVDASHPAVRAALSALVRSDPALELVGAADAPAADVLLLAHPAALADAGALIRAARRHAPHAAVVVTGPASGPDYDAAARAAGAAAHVELDAGVLGAVHDAAAVAH